MAHKQRRASEQVVTHVAASLSAEYGRGFNRRSL